MRNSRALLIFLLFMFFVKGMYSQESLVGIEKLPKSEFNKYLKKFNGLWVIYSWSTFEWNVHQDFARIVLGDGNAWFGKEIEIKDNKIHFLNFVEAYDKYHDYRICKIDNQTINLLKVNPSNNNYFESKFWGGSFFSEWYFSKKNMIIALETECDETPFEYLVLADERELYFNFASTFFFMRRINIRPKNFTIQLGVFSDLDRAIKFFKLLEKYNSEVFIFEEKKENEKIFKVQIGNFPSKEKALVLLNRLITDGFQAFIP